MKVLLVDDDEELAEIVKMVLDESADLDVKVANTSLEAIKLIEEGNFDIIVSDYYMDGMNGIDLFKYINGKLLKGIPFILITGADREDLVLEPVNGINIQYLLKGAEDIFNRLPNMIKEIVQESANP